MTQSPEPAPRRRMLKGVRLVFNNGHSVVNGVLRDISDTGARVSVENGLALPDEVKLVLDEGGSHQCLVARRELKELGLRFL
ncbi:MULTISPECIES: PilZ domain-containing protein [Rhizobium]|uniref:PilZ domain-containing protein n=1 Tax=Rhizobium rhizoryzae TaxID=451876 RepID=A0A7W6LHG1_9HYPH|nr:MULTISPECIES: PilZ domain-containing protein [Rhizobium]MBB4144306.1 hypothetical protein [Rhizobium rhizoryzae]